MIGAENARGRISETALMLRCRYDIRRADRQGIIC